MPHLAGAAHGLKRVVKIVSQSPLKLGNRIAETLRHFKAGRIMFSKSLL